MDPVVDSRTGDSHTPCEGVDSRDTAGILDTEDIPPCVVAFHRVLPRNHGEAADIPEVELLLLPLGEIHRDIHEAVEEEDTHTEAAVLPACREAFVHPDGHLPVVVAGDLAEVACDAVADRVEADLREVVDGLPPLRILRRKVLVLLPF